MKTKHTLSSLACMCLALNISCTDNDLVNQNREIIMTGKDFQYASLSRTTVEITPEKVHFKWASKDTVGIFPDKGGQVYFPITNGEGTNKATFSGGGWALKPSSQYVAYYPLIGQFYLDKRTIPVSFEGQEQTGNASTDHVGKCDFMAAVATNPTGNNVAFNFEHLGCLVELKITIPQKGSVDYVTLSADEELFTTKGMIDLTAEQPTITAIQKSSTLSISVKGVITTKDNEVVKVYFMMAPETLGGKQIRVSFNNGNSLIESTISPVDMIAGKAYSYNVNSNNQASSTNFVHVAKAGTLAQLIGEANKYKIEELKITGFLNDSDFRFLADMAGTTINGQSSAGILRILDMSEAHSVEKFYNEPNSSVIPNRAFYHCNSLEKVNLPRDLTRIAGEAFYNCTKLSSISIHEGMQTIDYGAFGNCVRLQTVKLPTTLKSLAGFNDCTNLTSIDIPTGVTAIGNNAFSDCTGLTSVNIPVGVTSIGNNAFTGCTGLTGIDIPTGVTTIGDYAFSGCTGLSSVTIPNSVKRISCFSSCSNLITVEIPEGVTEIGNNAFRNCKNLVSVKLPSTLEVIGGFSDCNSLKDITIPLKVHTILQSAFSWCRNLKRLTIPKSVVNIEYGAFQTNSTKELLDIQGRIKILESDVLNDTDILKLYLPSTLEQIRAGNFDTTDYIQEMYCNAVVPPYVYPNSLNPECTIYVPKGSLDAYKTAHWWKDYASQIVEIPSDFSKTTTIRSVSSKFVIDPEYYVLNFDGTRIEIDHTDLPLFLMNSADKDKILPTDKIYLKSYAKSCDIYRNDKVIGTVQMRFYASDILNISLGENIASSRYSKYKGKKVAEQIKWSDTRNPYRHCPIVSPADIDMRKMSFLFDITNNNEANDPIIAEMLMLYNKYIKPAQFKDSKTITVVNLENY